MTFRARTADRRLAALAVFGAVLALATVLWSLVGCAPKEAPAPPAGGEASEASPLDGQPANWSMESDCAICHKSEAASELDDACAQGVAHKAEGVACVQCHVDKDVLATAHADVRLGDEPAEKATVATVDPAVCESCHGTLEEVAVLTAESTALTDDNGTTVNPHARPSNEKHDANPLVCTDCHNNHSTDLPKDARKYCAQCHHRGVYECGTCHELRER
ncbi:hypothetical protein B5F40_02060 [Gordonibacter sp. An230]|uniref:cytochrome c3 family protein n=1 Tax=Gordonibacter sp. An230 TaxID=1965592 RepID=UPI000B379F34|nr:cytochrome c3 family protein [Gordonibacter sp. An230]OUO92135.1 hypothetical protein B5F40_02060 [Gordonibacter sp. An230]